jgi:hypothetical protein
VSFFSKNSGRTLALHATWRGRWLVRARLLKEQRINSPEQRRLIADCVQLARQANHKVVRILGELP